MCIRYEWAGPPTPLSFCMASRASRIYNLSSVTHIRSCQFCDDPKSTERATGRKMFSTNIIMFSRFSTIPLLQAACPSIMMQVLAFLMKCMVDSFKDFPSIIRILPFISWPKCVSWRSGRLHTAAALAVSSLHLVGKARSHLAASPIPTVHSLLRR